MPKQDKPNAPAKTDAPDAAATAPSSDNAPTAEGLSVEVRLAGVEASVASLESQFDEILSAPKKARSPSRALASAESEGDPGDTGVVCGRCGKTFTEDEAVEGVSCTHRNCPMNV